MSNTIKTLGAQAITREGLRVLHNNLAFARSVDRQYSDEFAKTGAKIGATTNVRLPNRYFVRSGAKLNVQNTTESLVPVTITDQKGVDINFTSAELTLELDEFSNRILTPALSRLATEVDYLGLGQFINVYHQVGTPGTKPGVSGGSGLAISNSPGIFLNAGALLDTMAVPRDGGRSIQLEPMAMAMAVDGLKALFHDGPEIASQFKKGMIGHAADFDFYMDQNVNTLLNGTRSGTASNFKVHGASQTGASLVCDWESDGAGTIAAGEIIEIAGVYSVNPENQQSTGNLAQFVVTAAEDVSQSTGGMSLAISPSIIVAGTGVANGTVTASPDNDAVITLKSGTASTYYKQNLAYHRDAFTLATVDLIMPDGVDFAAREVYDGISMRIVRQYDINNDTFPCRIDLMFGWATLRAELACRIAG